MLDNIHNQFMRILIKTYLKIIYLTLVIVSRESRLKCFDCVYTLNIVSTNVISTNRMNIITQCVVVNNKEFQSFINEV